MKFFPVIIVVRPATSVIRFILRCFCSVILASLLPTAQAEPDPARPAPAQQRFDPAIELPEGEGKQYVLAACTRCHTLEGLEAYKGYWGRQKWFEMVESMVKNGAVLDREQMEKVTDYLTANFGPGTRK